MRRAYSLVPTMNTSVSVNLYLPEVNCFYWHSGSRLHLHMLTPCCHNAFMDVRDGIKVCSRCKTPTLAPEQLETSVVMERASEARAHLTRWVELATDPLTAELLAHDLSSLLVELEPHMADLWLRSHRGHLPLAEAILEAWSHTYDEEGAPDGRG